MITNITTEAEFDEALAKPGLAVFKFTAPSWCRPCQAIRPHYEAASEKVDARLYDIDIDKVEVSLSNRYEIMSVPTIFAFRDGNLVGEIKEQNVLGLIKAIKEL